MNHERATKMIYHALSKKINSSSHYMICIQSLQQLNVLQKKTPPTQIITIECSIFFAIGIFMIEINTYLVINGKMCSSMYASASLCKIFTQIVCKSSSREREKRSFKFIRNISVCSYSLPPSSSSS